MTPPPGQTPRPAGLTPIHRESHIVVFLTRSPMKPWNLAAHLLVILVFCAALAVAPHFPRLLGAELVESTTHAKVKPATHVISTATLTEESNCSATSIGRHALLTASHCEAPSDFISIDGVPGYRIDEVIRDNNDHSILLIRGVDFKDFIPLGSRELRASEQVFIWGNPSLNGAIFIKQLHKGPYRASHVVKGRIVDVLGFQSFHGDSGSGVFSAKGELLGVVSFIGSVPIPPEGIIVAATGAVRLAFTSADRDRAANFE